MSYTSTYLAGAVGAGDNDRYAEVQNLKVGDLTLTATLTPGNGARTVTCTRVVDGNADTPGTLLVTGKNLAGQTITESLIPGANGILVSGSKLFASVSKVTGAGWVINGNNDTIIIGVGCEHYVSGTAGQPKRILISVAAASAINVTDGGKTLMILPASMAIGYYDFGGLAYGSLRVEPQGATTISVIHTPSLPTDYA